MVYIDANAVTWAPAFGSRLLLAAAGFLIVPTLILDAPIEPVMGFVQKIFYFHVPCAIMLFLSTFVCAGGSIAFLFKGSERGDRLAVAAAELSVLFGVCVLVSGPLWGRKAWGVWWQWDARLTSSLLLVLMMVGYLIARRYGGPAGRKLAAALALFAAINVPLVYKSVDIWRTVHPQTTVVPKLDPRMRPAFWSAFALMTLVWGAAAHAPRSGWRRARGRAGRRCAWTPKISRRRTDERRAFEWPHVSKSGPLAAVGWPRWRRGRPSRSPSNSRRSRTSREQEIPAGPFVGARLRLHLAGGAGLRGLRRRAGSSP